MHALGVVLVRSRSSARSHPQTLSTNSLTLSMGDLSLFSDHGSAPCSPAVGANGRQEVNIHYQARVAVKEKSYARYPCTADFP